MIFGFKSIYNIIQWIIIFVTITMKKDLIPDNLIPDIHFVGMRKMVDFSIIPSHLTIECVNSYKNK